ncbi:MAG: prepilin-type N-terminal cleavage/methylation domain-containing protein [Gemmatimonadaceae bacterium]|nr:prepilin-type N-terminal cleavage/methylation domain-containing protein [Gemmatimonadaceae bacterium]
MSARRKGRTRRGFTLAELMIAMALFSIVLTAAVGFLVAQSKGFRVLADRSAGIQNGRFGRDILRQEIRTAGTNVTEEQPTIVYASPTVFAFNSDLTTNRADSIRLTGAVYVDPFASDAEVTALTTSNGITIPGSGFAYPLQSYSQTTGVFINSDAELITFRFALDTVAGSEGTYALYRQVNDRPAEVVASGLRQSQSKPFFKYWYDPAKFGATNPNIDSVPANWLPLSKNVAKRGVAPDTGTATSMRIDALRAVEVVYEATPPRGTTRDVVRYMIPLPNVANARQSRACGRVPLAPPAPTLQWRADSNAVMVTWARGTDDGTGEQDAIRYVLWRKLSSVTTWGTPITTLGVAPTGSYAYKDASVQKGSGKIYSYALALQDCTPNLSTLSTSGSVTVP